jgi:hypothetical protein
VVDVTNGSDVDVGFGAIKHFRHRSLAITIRRASKSALKIKAF